jgi:hypothetical protein
MSIRATVLFLLALPFVLLLASGVRLYDSRRHVGLVTVGSASVARPPAISHSIDG